MVTIILRVWRGRRKISKYSPRLRKAIKKPNKNKNYDRWQKAIDCFVYLEKNCLGDGRKF